jgi:SAM-dependent methyltransferase
VSCVFDNLVDGAVRAPITGWDFSWLEGRATEERPPWRYSSLLARHARTATRLLDLQTGGGELLSELPHVPPFVAATEAWPPNVTRAASILRDKRMWVVAADDRSLPFGSESFDLVVSRHPVATCWGEIARVLVPGGRFLSQQVGPGTMREVTEFFMGPLDRPSTRAPELAVADAESAGLRVDDVRSARLRATFSDVGAVVYFLRLVIWTVPDFSVERYRERLYDLHRHIEANGPFVAHATRFLIEAAKP